MDVVVDDVLGVVSLYATAHTTIDLLVLFLPMLMYNKNLWKQKATIESRGLMVDDAVVDGNWYEYYLIRNRTYWGNLVTMKQNKRGDVRRNGISESDEPVIFAHEGFIQYPNMDMHFTTPANSVAPAAHYHSHNINRKVRHVHRLNNTDVLVVDEYGELWGYHKGTTATYKKLAIGTYVVSIQQGYGLLSDYAFLLERDSKLRILKIGLDGKLGNGVHIRVRSGLLPVNDTNPPSSIVAQTEPYGTFLMSTGTIVSYEHEDLRAWTHNCTKGKLFLSDTITTALQERCLSERSYMFRVVGTTETSILASDRTIYNVHPIKSKGDTSEGYQLPYVIRYITPQLIKITKHRAQNIYQVGNTVYTIIDPIRYYF